MSQYTIIKFISTDNVEKCAGWCILNNAKCTSFCRLCFIQKPKVTLNQPSSIDETVQGDRYVARMNAESGIMVQPNPAYHSVSYMNHTSRGRLDSITERQTTALAPMQVYGTEGEIQNIYEDVKVVQ